MLKSRYLLLLSAFFISTFATPTLGVNQANLLGSAGNQQPAKRSYDCDDQDVKCFGGKTYLCNRDERKRDWDSVYYFSGNTYIQTLSGARHKCVVETFADWWGGNEGTHWCYNTSLKTNNIPGAEYCLIQDGKKYECRTVGQSYTDSARSNACLNGTCTTGYYQDGQTCKQIKPNETICKSSDPNATESKYNQNNKCVPTKCKNTHYLENDKCTPITPNSTECKNHNIEHATQVIYDNNYQCTIVKMCEQNYIPDQQGTKCINKIGTQCSTADLNKQNAKAGVYKKNGKDITCFATECRDGAYLVKKANVEQGFCFAPKCSNDQEPNIIDEKYIDPDNKCKNKTADKVEEADEKEDNEQEEHNENTDKTTLDKVAGKIIEEGTNNHISGANIKIKDSDTSTTSDNQGTFSLQNVPANAQLEISHPDYETKTVTPEANVNISLTKRNQTTTAEGNSATDKDTQENNSSGNNNSNTNGNQTPEDGTDCTTEKNNPAVKHAEYKSGTCVATACNDGYYLTDGNCADINGSPCDNLPTNATAGKREYNTETRETTCIVTACDKYYIVSKDKKSCEKDPEQEIQELKDKAQAAKDKEQSTENKLLGAVGIGATGIGGMQLASALAEQSADADALTDMTAYLETFKCTYGNNASVSGGTANIETPGGNSLLPLYTEYVSLANDLKLRKNMLGMSAGIESQAILSSANGNLYNNDTTDKTTGAYASLARALADPTGADAQKLSQQQTETADKLKTGAIVAGVGAIGSLAGNLIINKDKYFNKDGEYKSVCDYETDSHTNCITYFNNTPLSKKDKDIMSALSIAYLKKIKGHDATCDKSDIHSTNKRAYIKCASTDGKYDWEIKFTINDDLNSADQKKNIFSTVCKMYTGSNASDKTCNANETQCNEITNTMSAMGYTTTYNSSKCELK